MHGCSPADAMRDKPLAVQIVRPFLPPARGARRGCVGSAGAQAVRRHGHPGPGRVSNTTCS
eukprot:720588-Lingulodinium_polyedra.AAC.1